MNEPMFFEIKDGTGHIVMVNIASIVFVDICQSEDIGNNIFIKLISGEPMIRLHYNKSQQKEFKVSCNEIRKFLGIVGQEF